MRPTGTGARASSAVVVSCAAGILLGVLVRVNAALGEHIGVMEATFVIHLVGTVFAVVLVARRLSGGFARQLAREGSRHELTGGLLGVAMVFLSNTVVSHLGVALAVSVFIASDLLLSTAADRVGFLRLRKIALTWQRVVGLLMAIAGVLLIRWS